MKWPALLLFFFVVVSLAQDSETLSEEERKGREMFVTAHLNELVVTRFVSIPDDLIQDIKTEFPKLYFSTFPPGRLASPVLLIFQDIGYYSFPSEWDLYEIHTEFTLTLLVGRFKDWLVQRAAELKYVNIAGTMDFYPDWSKKLVWRDYEIELL